MTWYFAYEGYKNGKQVEHVFKTEVVSQLKALERAVQHLQRQNIDLRKFSLTDYEPDQVVDLT
jgi:hypothetical protein